MDVVDPLTRIELRCPRRAEPHKHLRPSETSFPPSHRDTAERLLVSGGERCHCGAAMVEVPHAVLAAERKR